MLHHDCLAHRAAIVGMDLNEIVTLRGPLDASLPYRYLGADDQTGPDHTGQPSVASYYEEFLSP
jgi:hypothetical protein